MDSIKPSEINWQILIGLLLLLPVVVFIVDRGARSTQVNPADLKYLKISDPIERVKLQAAEQPSLDQWIELALLYYRAGKYSESINAARRALQLDAESAVAYNNICAAQASQKMWAEAVQACQQALTLDSNMQIAKNNLAWALDGQAGKY